MARQKYEITGADYWTARKWLQGKADKNGLELKEKGGNFIIEAKAKLEEIPFRYKVAKKVISDLQAWCDTYLSEKDVQQMKTTIRATRMREKKSGSKKQITLDEQAWLMLSSIAEAENVTLSQAIRKHLARQYMKSIGTDKSLQKDLLDS